MTSGLSIRNISKCYGPVAALTDVSLEIPRGLFGLLGPNGAGKSTLMRTIATLQSPDAGSLHLDGIDVLRDPHGARRRLGFLPQDFNVYPRATPLELMDYFAQLKGVAARAERRATIERLLVATNLWSVRTRALGGFSGGMRQRFGVAQALIGNPSLLIVDEPTAGLDPEERLRLMDLLCVAAELATVLFSTHIVEDVQAICSTMAMIQRGRIVATGNPRDAVAALAGRVWRVEAPRAVAARHVGEDAILTRRRIEGAEQVHVFAETRPGPNYEPVSPTLEHVYFHRIGPQGRGDDDRPAV